MNTDAPDSKVEVERFPAVSNWQRVAQSYGARQPRFECHL